jgi:hypothetical protein
LVQQDPISLGVIDDDETIVRGAFDPRSGNARTRLVKSAIIPKPDLLSGNFSVWRIEPEGISCDRLISRLDVIPGQSLFALCAIAARDLRAMKIGSERALSVVDECECDQAGNKHEAHAHIALCKGLVAQGVGKDHPDFEQLRLELHVMFKDGVIWEKLPPAPKVAA